jgi:hypothetical protein
MSDVRERLQQAGASLSPPIPDFDGLLRRRARKQRSERVAAIAVALVAAAVVGSALHILGGIGRTEGRPATGGRAALSPLSLRPGQYFYLKVWTSRAVDGHVLDRETWWAKDDSGEVQDRSTRPDKYPPLPDGTFGPGKFPEGLGAPDFVSKLSTNPDRLARQLRRISIAAGFSSAVSEGVWGSAGDALLETPDAAPDLRAAMFQVVASLHGVTAIGDTQDPAGRDAVALQFVYDHILQRMYFDRENHQLMAWTSSYRGNSPAWAVLDSGVVGSAGAQPSGHQWLYPPAPPGFTP